MRSIARWSRDSHEGRPSSDPTAVATSTVSVESTHQTIALFGAGSKTATHFLRLALDAGYHVRALLIQQSSSDQNHHHGGGKGTVNAEVAATAQALKEEFTDQASALHWVRADSIYDAKACQRVLRGADFVVCMMNEAPTSCYIDAANGATALGVQQNRSRANSASSTDRQSLSLCKDHFKPLTSFVQVLYPLMKEVASIQVFLYQANSLAVDVKGRTPVFSKVLKTATAVRVAASNLLPTNGSGTRPPARWAVADQDSVVREVVWHHRGRGSDKSHTAGHDENDSIDNEDDTKHVLASFCYIITRPAAFLKDGPSIKRVSASKSQPGPFPLAHVDLAEFSLNALLTQKLYNTCPYVVA